MILAYKSIATPWVVQSPNFSTQFTQLIDAFINDTSLISAQQRHQNFCNLLTSLQQNLDLWHGLLQASSGVLNPSKCVWLCFTWKFAPNGTVRIVAPPTQSPHLYTTVTNKMPYPIKQLQPTEAHQYLGIYLTADRNHKQELATFVEQNQTYIQLLQNCPFPKREVHVIYHQCYLLTVGYPLLATVIPLDKLYKHQSPATTIFLNKLGYP